MATGVTDVSNQCTCMQKEISMLEAISKHLAEICHSERANVGGGMQTQSAGMSAERYADC